VKRILIGLVLGTLLALSVASDGAARVSITGLPNFDRDPDIGSTRTVIDAGSRQRAHLRAIDAMFYPDSLGATGAWMIRDVNYQVA
jgi:hypothetical protein